jgi:hypothetical protein
LSPQIGFDDVRTLGVFGDKRILQRRADKERLVVSRDHSPVRLNACELRKGDAVLFYLLTVLSG